MASTEASLPVDAEALQALEAAAMADKSSPPSTEAVAAGSAMASESDGGDITPSAPSPAATRRWSWWPGRREESPSANPSAAVLTAPKKPPYTRTRNRLLGMDVIHVDDPAVIRALLASGTVDRVGAPPGSAATAAVDEVAHLPMWLRRYLPLTRGHPAGGWFLALLPSGCPAYGGRRAYLEAKFAPDSPGSDVDSDVAAAASALVDSAEAAAGLPAAAEEAAALEAAFVNAIGRRFHKGCPVPTPVIKAAAGGATSPTDAFKPWVVWRARRADEVVATYARSCLAADADAVACRVHPSVASDIAHGVLTTPNHDPAVLLLRAAYAEAAAGRWGAAARPVGSAIFARVGIVASVPRLVVTGGDLGGLLMADEPPAVAGETVVQLGLAAAAAETENPDWAWAAGGPERQCVARAAIEAFVANVRDEVGRQLGTPQGREGGSEEGGQEEAMPSTGSPHTD
ncbi:hypothetical protein MMPV_003855 [Pyropia vietnamensis]